MSIRSILAPLVGSSEQQVLETAVALAARHGAWLDAMFLKTVRVIPGGSLGSAEVIALATQARAAAEELEEGCAAMRETLAALCRRHGLPLAGGASAEPAPAAAWSETAGPGALTRLGRTSDLVVLGRPADRDGRELAEALLRGSGRPVLVVPPEGGATAPYRRIAIAVNDSLEAARAMSAALPFLAAAQAVTILTAESARTEAAVAARAAVFLARHGVTAEVRVFPKDDEPPVGRALLGHCRQLDAELLVIGAYSHSRAHELLLGGVTSYMLACLDRPVLMAH